MKTKMRAIAVLLALALLAGTGAPAFSAGVRDLDNRLGGDAIEKSGTAPMMSGGSCAGGSCGNSLGASVAPSGGSGIFGGVGGFLAKLGGFFKSLFGGILDFIRNLFGGGGIFGGGGGGGGGDCGGGDCGGGGGTTGGGGWDGGGTTTTTGGGTTTTTGGGDTTTTGGGTTTTTGGDTPATPPGGGTTATPPPSTPAPPSSGPKPIQSDVRSGGGSMERTGYEWARRQVRPATNDPTVLKHEAVHYINSELSIKHGGGTWKPVAGKSHAFYIWGENKYWVVPNTTVKKIDVIPLVPTHLTSSHKNYFYNHDFGQRDGLHILEDLSAEISSGEKSHLLFDMVVNSAALGLKMEQLDAAGTNKYWSGPEGAALRGTIKDFYERAAIAGDPRMQKFGKDGDGRSVALRNFLVRNYGSAWTAKVLGI